MNESINQSINQLKSIDLSDSADGGREHVWKIYVYTTAITISRSKYGSRLKK